MITSKNKKIPFLPGLGALPKKEKKALSKAFDLRTIDWNKGTITPLLYKETILGGFSMGAVEACEYALKHKVDTLVLCSLTPGIESLTAIKANRVLFFVGEKETWVKSEVMRLTKTLKCEWQVITIPTCDHQMNKKYIGLVLDVVSLFG